MQVAGGADEVAGGADEVAGESEEHLGLRNRLHQRDKH